MILYKSDLKTFRDHVDTNQISDLIEESFRLKLGRRVNSSEKRSWTNSMSFMEKIVRKADLADSCGILLEYILPSTSKRIDFLISGEDEKGNKNFIIIELKQWESAEATEQDGIVSTFINGGIRETTHPSYQAVSYKNFLEDFNENISNDLIHPYACAYLHNYKEQNPEPLKNSVYNSILLETPIFFKDDYSKLEQFLNQHVRFGNGSEILYLIDSGNIKPSKKLIDYVGSMYKGNQEFVLIDEQKIAYEHAKSLAKNAKEKSVLIVKGGPGTGKSVIAVNLLGGLLKDNLNVNFIAPNSSFREVMMAKLAKSESKVRLKNLFKGSSSFVETPADTFDVLIVDEAHRLKKKGAYQYKGINQVDDIIKSAKTAIFFVDDNQMIRPDDVGSVAEIKKVAEFYGAKVTEIDLVAQFRCSGAEGYLNWLDDTLHIRHTANFDGWEQEDFEFLIFEDPNELRKEIELKNTEGFNARILAGYAWKWTSQKEGNVDGEVEDVVIPEFDFRMPWNSRKVGTTWAIDQSGIEQVGCIHTSQGLEFDYVGVIIGNDLRFDSDKMEYYVDWNSYKDSTGKKGLKNNPEELAKLVKNIYKTLLSRGMKGCYVYFVDKEVEKYFTQRLVMKHGELIMDEGVIVAAKKVSR